jgi:hypothetical protein
MSYIIIHANDSRKEYFFSTDHCQGVKGVYPEGPDWVPTTFSLPHWVVPRPSLPSGWVSTVEELVLIYFHDSREIPNPDPQYQEEHES